MAVYVDEQLMIENNMFLHEDRLKSPSSRFLDQSTPTFVTYYHINNTESTTDVGFIDVYSVIGDRSPIRYNKIENFPLYGIEQVVLQLQDTEYGLDTDFQSEATVLPNTIKPLMNDFFIIVVSGKDYIFRVTDIQYDNILPDNFYKIGFYIYSLEQDKRDKLEEQITSEHVCILENIGTEENCIIEKQVFVDIKALNAMYRSMIDFYIAMFYNKRHNVFLAPYNSTEYLYDPYQNEFINKNRLFDEKKSLTTLVLTKQVNDPKEVYKYNKSFYKLIEMQDMQLLDEFKFVTITGCTYTESTFYRWYERNIHVLHIPNPVPVDAQGILSPEFKTVIKMNGEVDSEHAKLIRDYIRKVDLHVKDIPLTLADELISMNDSLEVFFFIPVIMYIIRDIIKKDLHVTKR